MKIVILTKQVPSVEHVGFNQETKTIIREGVPNEVNPFDRRAIGQAVALKEQFGGEIVVATMGPPQAEEALREHLAAGADRAVHLCDRAFAGSDTLATARALAALLRREGFDLVLCGKYSVDAETGQVGPEVAELLGIPQVTGATSLQVEDGGRRALVGRETDAGIDTLEVELPALLTAAERLIRPPRVSPEEFEAARSKPMQVLTAADLGLGDGQVGFKGSPTWVADITSVKPQRQTITIQADDAQRASQALVEQLLERGLFSGWQDAAQRQPLPEPVQDPASDKAIWVVAEALDGKVLPVSLELMGGAAEVAQRVGGQVCALLIGHGVARHSAELAANGAEVVYVADDARLAEYGSETYAHVLASAIQAHSPWAVLVPATSNGRDFTPRVAARLGLGLTGDAVGLELDGEGRLKQLKPAFGGTIVAPILSNTLPQVATVRPGMLEQRQPDPSRRATLRLLALDGLPTPRTRLVSREAAGSGGVDLDTAEIVVCAGAGLGEAENLRYVDELAEALGAAVGGSRRVVDNGWLPRQQQIGLTGKVINPHLYVGVAVRGAFNHLIGIQRAGTVVAINNDPQAPIFEHADFAVVGDYKEVVPALAAAVKEAKSRSASGVSS
jgi:electron transfer flavoprotein alpha subunit